MTTRSIRQVLVRAIAASVRVRGIDENLLALKLLARRGRGTMIDVGACHGVTALPFARQGWEVHAFEPDPANREVLERNVATERFKERIHVVPRAVADRSSEATIFSSPESPGISSLAPFTEAHQQGATVEVTTLRDYCRSMDIRTVDYLKIDVEGFERDVLSGVDWGRTRPEAIVVEFEDAKTVPRGYDWHELAGELEARGYSVVVSEWEPIVRYGVAHRWSGFKRYPCELETPEAWGNLIAVEPWELNALMRVAKRHELAHSISSRVNRVAQIVPVVRRLA